MAMLYLLLLLLQYKAVQSKCSNPIVETVYGSVCGGLEVSRAGNPFHSFQGIPFAAPPTGALRFHRPVPPQPWDSVLDVSGRKIEFCIQYDYFIPGKLAGQEDCLYLNVYRPQ